MESDSLAKDEDCSIAIRFTEGSFAGSFAIAPWIEIVLENGTIARTNTIVSLKVNKDWIKLRLIGLLPK